MNNLYKAFAEGYNLGTRAAKQVYGGRTKIEVQQYQTKDSAIKMEKLDNGTIHNIGGRSIPF